MVIDWSIVDKAAEPPAQRSQVPRRDLRSVSAVATEYPATTKQLLRRATRTHPLLATSRAMVRLASMGTGQDTASLSRRWLSSRCERPTAAPPRACSGRGAGVSRSAAVAPAISAWTPRVRQSGAGPASHGHISRQGSNSARHALVEACCVKGAVGERSAPVVRGGGRRLARVTCLAVVGVVPQGVAGCPRAARSKRRKVKRLGGGFRPRGARRARSAGPAGRRQSRIGRVARRGGWTATVTDQYTRDDAGLAGKADPRRAPEVNETGAIRRLKDTPKRLGLVGRDVIEGEGVGGAGGDPDEGYELVTGRMQEGPGSGRRRARSSRSGARRRGRRRCRRGSTR